MAAAGGSAATTTARQVISPDGVRTRPGATSVTGVFRSISSAGSGAASARGSAAMPSAGRPIRPRAKERMMTARTWLEVASSRSSSTPDRNGRSSSSMIASESPARRSAFSALVSGVWSSRPTGSVA